jgi:hypothetical protein
MKHQFMSPGEIPNYQPTKFYNPNMSKRAMYQQRGRMTQTTFDLASTTNKTAFYSQYQFGVGSGGNHPHQFNHRYSSQKSSMHRQFFVCSNNQSVNASMKNKTPNSINRAMSIEYMKRVFDSKYAATEQQFNQLYPGCRRHTQVVSSLSSHPRTPTFQTGQHGAYNSPQQFQHPHQSSPINQQHFFNFNNPSPYSFNNGNEMQQQPHTPPAYYTMPDCRDSQMGSQSSMINSFSFLSSVPSTPCNPNNATFFATPFQSPQQQQPPLHAIFPHSYIYQTPVQTSSLAQFAQPPPVYSDKHNMSSAESLQSLDGSLNQSYSSETSPQLNVQLPHNQPELHTPPPAYSLINFSQTPQQQHSSTGQQQLQHTGMVYNYQQYEQPSYQYYQPCQQMQPQAHNY